MTSSWRRSELHRSGGRRRGIRLRSFVLASVAVLGAASLTACDPPFDVRVDAGPTELYPPTFSRDIHDYVNRCDPTRPTPMRFELPAGTTVTIGSSPRSSGVVNRKVRQRPGQSFSFVLRTGGQASRYHVRCLATDFPTWRAEITGTPQAAFYQITANDRIDDIGGHSVIFDTNGVPVWWRARTPSYLFNPQANGGFGSVNYSDGRVIESLLDGSVTRTFFGPPGTKSDNHDLQLLTNGNYVFASQRRDPCDLSSWAPSLGTQTCVNHIFTEVTPAGAVVWEWDAAAHIPPSETPEMWREQQTVDHDNYPERPWDTLHYNSVEEVPGGFVINFRHLNAAYRVERATGDITWKLGGSDRPESLSIVGDPQGGPSGGHDVRMTGTTLTMLDNGTRGIQPKSPARNVTYTIDTAAMTATLASDVRDPIAPTLNCCGSSRHLPGGNIVTGWGGTPHTTEITPSGKRVFLLDIGFVYRSIPLLPGQFTIEQFRAGMDAQYANGLLD